MAHWLIKSEPETFSLDDFRTEKVTVWYGVRNYTARNNLRFMQLGDLALFYRSVKKPAAIAIAKVVREYYQDPTTEETAWVAVDFELIEEFRTEVPLSKIKETPELQNMELLRLSRLSTQRVSEEEFNIVCKMGREI
jgi:predicted RNA-binding protein with PUA-like domain